MVPTVLLLVVEMEPEVVAEVVERLGGVLVVGEQRLADLNLGEPGGLVVPLRTTAASGRRSCRTARCSGSAGSGSSNSLPCRG